MILSLGMLQMTMCLRLWICNFRGLWDKEKVLGELRYYKMNNQICIANQETLDRLVIFKESYEVANSDK